MTLTHELVAQGLMHGLTTATEMGFSVSCGVIDSSGRTMGVLRHTDAGWATPEITLGKATVALVYHTPTRALYDRWQRERPLFGANVASWGSTRGWYVCEGGVPITDGQGHIVGAVGVAGCFPAIKDDEVAAAVAGWLQERL